MLQRFRFYHYEIKRGRTASIPRPIYRLATQSEITSRLGRRPGFSISNGSNRLRQTRRFCGKTIYNQASSETQFMKIYWTAFRVVLLTASWQVCCADQGAQSSPSASPSDGPPQKPYYLTGNEEVWSKFSTKASSWFINGSSRPPDHAFSADVSH